MLYVLEPWQAPCLATAHVMNPPCQVYGWDLSPIETHMSFCCSGPF